MASFADFIQSPQFTFFVGQEGKAITVHAGAIAATSLQLDALINGGMKESESRCAKLEDVEVDDFVRFCEYAYRGDYTVPRWEDIPLEQRSEHDEWDNLKWGSLSKKKMKKFKRSVQIEVPAEAPAEAPTDAPTEAPPEVFEHAGAFDDHDRLLTESAIERPHVALSRTVLRSQFNTRPTLVERLPKTLILDQSEPKGNSAVHQNFGPVFLAHARLYCFAHVRLIEPLKILTLDKLQRTLMSFKLYNSRVGDIIELARFVYSSPDLPASNGNDALDDLKNLVTKYMACEIDVIGKHDDFVQFLEEGGEFVGNFWKIVRQFMV